MLLWRRPWDHCESQLQVVKPRADSFRPDRRAVLTAAGIMLAAGLPLRAAASTPRLAAIDWAMLETAIAIGHMPVAACELIRYRADTIEPKIPDNVTDLGLRGAPNFELLQLERPDLILNSPYYAKYEDRLRRLAPVLSLPFYIPGETPFPKVMAALHELANSIDDPKAGETAAATVTQTLAQYAAKLTEFSDRPICLVNIGDSRHLRAYGFDSLFGSTLKQLGLENAWSGKTEFSFLAPVPIERLITMPDARLVSIGQIPVEAQRALARSVLWQALPQITENRFYQLPDVNAFGGAPSATLFARLLTEAFQAGPVSNI